MNLSECLAVLGSDYNEILERMITEERVKKYLAMFSKDTSFEELCMSMAEGDYETAFRAAHTLKGVCANLGIENLRAKASEITEALRGNVNNGADAILPEVIDAYTTAIDAINLLE